MSNSLSLESVWHNVPDADTPIVRWTSMKRLVLDVEILNALRYGIRNDHVYSQFA